MALSEHMFLLPWGLDIDICLLYFRFPDRYISDNIPLFGESDREIFNHVVNQLFDYLFNGIKWDTFKDNNGAMF